MQADANMMMVYIDVIDRIFLGCGGTRPGVMAIQDNIDHTEWFAELMTSESVYALDMNIEARLLAFGTRAGKIYVKQLSDDGHNDNRATCQEWFQGAPVLSVCWLDYALLCSSDSSGQCLLWTTTAPERPKSLETNGCVICALTRTHHGELVGLASEGYLLFWSIPQGDLVRCMEGPRPASKLGLVNLRYWPRHDVLLYPTEDGHLCGYQLGATEVHCIKAHQGAFYVVIPAERSLITVGKEDGLIKIWHDLNKGPVSEMEVLWSRGFIAGWAMEPEAQSVLLIDEEGDAGVFDLTETSAQLTGQLMENGFRAVAGMSPDELARCRRASDEAKARKVITQATELIGQGRPEQLDGIAGNLESLGFTRSAFGIRAHRARLQNDPLGELEIRRQLAQIMDGDNDASRNTMKRYAFLLEQFWQLPYAWSVYHKLDTEINDHNRNQWLEKAAKVVTDESHIIESDIPLSDSIRAANLLDTVFSGTWVLAGSKTMTLPPEVSTVEDFLDKYELLRQEPGHEAAPTATSRTVWWISRKNIKEPILIEFESDPSSGQSHIESALRFDHCGTMSTLTPVLLLKVDGTTQSVQEHNQEVLHLLEQMERDGFTNTERWDLQRLVTLTVRRLWTESAWRRQGGKEIAHE